MPTLFPRPSLTGDAHNRMHLVWMRDIGTPGSVNPEVFYAAKDSAGSWGAPEQITSNDLTELDPIVTILPDGRILAVWTQGRLSRSRARENPSLSMLLDNQDVYYAVRGTSGWSAPAPVLADAVPRADGMASMATAPDGTGTLLWCRSVGDSAMAAGSGEIYSSKWSGSGFDAPVRVTTNTIDDLARAVAFDGSGVAGALWLETRPDTAGNVCDIWTARSAAGQWTAPERLINSDRPDRIPWRARSPTAMSWPPGSRWSRPLTPRRSAA